MGKPVSNNIIDLYSVEESSAITIIKHSKMPMFILKNNKIKLTNKYMAQIYEKEVDEIEGKPLSEIITEDITRQNPTNQKLHITILKGDKAYKTDIEIHPIANQVETYFVILHFCKEMEKIQMANHSFIDKMSEDLEKIQKLNIILELAMTKESHEIRCEKICKILVNLAWLGVNPQAAVIIKKNNKYEVSCDIDKQNQIIDTQQESSQILDIIKISQNRRVMYPLYINNKTMGYLILSMKNNKVDLSENQNFLNSTAKIISSMVELEINKEEMTQQKILTAESTKFNYLGEVSSGIAHEINNPLTIIMGFTEILKNELEKNGEEKVMAYLDKISNMSFRIQNTVHLMRELSKRKETETKIYNLKDIFIDVEKFNIEKARYENISLNIEKIPEYTVVKVNKNSIVDAILSLIRNAYEFLNPLQIDNKSINISFEIQEKKTLIQVKNSGPKISKEIEEKIFMPFFSTKEERKSSGLGIPLASNTIQQSKGSLYLDQNCEQTCFIINLPSRDKRKLEESTTKKAV